MSTHLASCQALGEKIKATAATKSVYDPELRQLRFQLRDACKTALLSDPALTQTPKVEHLVWKHAFYRPIEEFRRQLHTTQGERLNKTRTAFLLFLSDAQKYYKDLAEDLQQVYGAVEALKTKALPPVGPMQLSDIHKNKAPANDATKQHTASSSGAVDITAIVARCAVCIGDLMRYSILAAPAVVVDTNNTTNQIVNNNQASTTTDVSTLKWRPSREWYRIAATIDPGCGNAHNQLAVLAAYANNDAIAAFYYCRALAASRPFTIAGQNLAQLADRTRTLLKKADEESSSAHQAKNRGGDRRNSGAFKAKTTKSNAELDKAVQQRYCLVINILVSTIDIDRFPELLNRAGAELSEYVARASRKETEKVKKLSSLQQKGVVKNKKKVQNRKFSMAAPADDHIQTTFDQAYSPIVQDDEEEIDSLLAIIAAFFFCAEHQQIPSSSASATEKNPTDVLRKQVQLYALSAVCDTLTRLTESVLALLALGEKGLDTLWAVRVMAVVRLGFQWLSTSDVSRSLLVDHITSPLVDVGGGAQQQQQEKYDAGNMVGKKVEAFISSLITLCSSLQQSSKSALLSKDDGENMSRPSEEALPEDVLFKGYPPFETFQTTYLDFNNSDLWQNNNSSKTKSSGCCKYRRAMDVLKYASLFVDRIAEKCNFDELSTSSRAVTEDDPGKAARQALVKELLLCMGNPEIVERLNRPVAEVADMMEEEIVYAPPAAKLARHKSPQLPLEASTQQQQQQQEEPENQYQHMQVDNHQHDNNVITGDEHMEQTARDMALQVLDADDMIPEGPNPPYYNYQNQQQQQPINAENFLAAEGMRKSVAPSPEAHQLPVPTSATVGGYTLTTNPADQQQQAARDVGFVPNWQQQQQFFGQHSSFSYHDAMPPPPGQQQQQQGQHHQGYTSHMPVPTWGNTTSMVAPLPPPPPASGSNNNNNSGGVRQQPAEGLRKLLFGDGHH